MSAGEHRGELMISSTSVGSEGMAVYLKGKKPCLSAVTCAGIEDMTTCLSGNKSYSNTVSACTWFGNI